ncbi:MAG: alpha/beta hydrolase [Bacteroidia bacterium]|nr:alpha/beta hydrolase [Bacteroidia bacterium]
MISNCHVHGLNVYYTGDIKKRALVFIHGNSLNSKTFQSQMENLPFPVMAFDLPGHGLSDRYTDFENIYCLPGYVSALKNLVAEFGMSDFILAGHSLGGHIALEAAEELNQTKGLFIFGTPPIGIPPEMDKMFLPNPNIAHLFSKDISESDAMTVGMEFVFNNQTLAADLKAMILNTDGNTRLNLGASIGKGQFKNEKEFVSKTNLPIGIVQGNKETLVNLEYIKELSIPNLWNNKINILENVGHIPQMENAEKFNSIIIDFCNSVFS